MTVVAYSFCEVVELHQALESGSDDGATASQALHVTGEWRRRTEGVKQVRTIDCYI